MLATKKDPRNFTGLFYMSEIDGLENHTTVRRAFIKNGMIVIVKRKAVWFRFYLTGKLILLTII
ncbi:hypothetical protein A616_19475 [Brevibacillus brevis X23]|nr:hypothetical protein A616_19475 [Brevibacillus brevis X23]